MDRFGPLPICRNCGACCAAFRVSFYWAEGDDADGVVPTALTHKVGPLRRAMRGTEGSAPRCVALSGEVGKLTACSIYALRPGPCREFTASWEDGVANEACDRARHRHGLLPLRPEDWVRDEEPEEPEEPKPLWPRRRQAG